MTIPPLPLIDGCLFIDNSGWMEGCSTCYRYLQYRNLSLRVSAAEKPSLNFGSAGHLAKELRYLHYGNREAPQQYYEDLQLLLSEFYEQHPVPAEDWRTLNWAMTMTKRYDKKFVTEDFRLLEWEKSVDCPYCEGRGQLVQNVDDGELAHTCIWCRGTGKRSPMVEMTFALPLFTWKGTIDDFSGANDSRYDKAIPVIYTGRIDLPVVLPDGTIWVMDHKHVGQFGDMFWNEQRMTAQHRGYVWAFKELTGLDVKGYVVNAIRTKEPPQYVKDGTPYRGKTQTPETWFNESFQRERFLCESWKIDEWKNNTIDLVEEFFWHYQRGYFPMKTKWCSHYGKCPSFDACTLAPDDRDVFLQSEQFGPNEWTPLKQPKV